MRVGIIILPEHRWAQAAPRWRAAEAYGFDHVWTYDHIGWRNLVDGPWFDAVATLTAAATVTERIRLGTMVASPNFRHPVSFARCLLALDDIAGGRFTLGVGSGGIAGYDNLVTGGSELSPRVRVDRFTEFVELTDALLTRERTDFAGEYYTAVQARSAPGCVQRPRLPFVVAANGPRSMRLAARFGQGWVTTGERGADFDTWWRAVAQRAEQFDAALAATGRDGAGIDRFLSVDSAPVYSLTSVESFRDALGRAAALGYTDVVAHWPRPDGYYAGSEAVLERVAAEVLPGRNVI
ncbi:MAG TPA: LLM class flavin-dependent oxidoreductase [Actinophytocola sp.]|uniref:LLM class flavin-dependent oxidoreductase n=1 Tax=Actinophytocola sp. TaxID=1872138 RepID=UPI002DB8D3C4|nr:LLM class flavin-dependent oxidoreductase [Actinophytocola sp.]HEU5473266.1 LLM class flavin-dependent oxidoreductase [Actinophytocola sp.]